MSILDALKNIKKAQASGFSLDALQTAKNWYNDKYEWSQVQRNILVLLVLLFSGIIIFFTISIVYIKSTSTIEPFVIEIEPKSGVPTVVDPISAKVYSGQETIKRYYIWRYVKLREEYVRGTYQRSFNEVALMSVPEVFSQFRSLYSTGNPESPYNRLGEDGMRIIELKSMTFIEEKSVQVRFRTITRGGEGEAQEDRVAYLEFDFENIEMNDDQRLLNPLGYRVKKYRVENEKL